jgi:hypothetical protein
VFRWRGSIVNSLIVVVGSFAKGFQLKHGGSEHFCSNEVNGDHINLIPNYSTLIIRNSNLDPMRAKWFLSRADGGGNPQLMNT